MPTPPRVAPLAHPTTRGSTCPPHHEWLRPAAQPLADGRVVVGLGSGECVLLQPSPTSLSPRAEAPSSARTIACGPYGHVTPRGASAGIVPVLWSPLERLSAHGGELRSLALCLPEPPLVVSSAPVDRQLHVWRVTPSGFRRLETHGLPAAAIMMVATADHLLAITQDSQVLRLINPRADAIPDDPKLPGTAAPTSAGQPLPPPPTWQCDGWLSAAAPAAPASLPSEREDTTKLPSARGGLLGGAPLARLHPGAAAARGAASAPAAAQ